jgi:hypothetical protein
MKPDKSPGKTWRVSELIDLEYFLGTTTEEKTGIDGDADAAGAEERRIYLAFSQSHTPPFSRRELLKFWLEEKRQKERPALGHDRTPGAMFQEALSLTRLVIIITALLSGMALAWSVLSYRGAEPINIFTCLWVFILPQVLMLILLCCMAVFRHLGLSYEGWGIYPLLAALLRRAAMGLKSAGENRLSGERRHRIHAVFGMIGQQKTLYGPIFYRPVFILFQIFGVCFNIGLMGASLVKIMITDLAFGWQTTLQAGAESVHGLVAWIALPWSWLPPLFPAHPSLSQIAGSRIILKDGMAHLATPDLVSWWPFLVMAIIVYGLIPRVLLLAYGIAAQSRALGRLSFSHSACDRLIRRMQTPRLESGGRPLPRQTGTDERPAMPPEGPVKTATGQETLIITGIPEELHDRFVETDISDRMRLILGPVLLHRFLYRGDAAADIRVLEALLAELPAGKTDITDIRIMFVQEAWLPPIRETLSWIKAMRRAAGPRTGMIIGLVGKPVRENSLTSPADADRLIWQQAVSGLGDPYIRVEALGG